MSSGRPALLSGMPLIILSIFTPRFSPGKTIVPGATLFTWMCGASAFARERVSEITPAFEAQ